MADLLSYALCTVDDVKELLGIASSDTTKDNLIKRKINDATERIEGYCQRRFKSTTYTDEVYDGTGYDSLLLRNYPVTAFTSLSARDTSLNDNDFNSVDANQYFINSNDGIVEAISTFYGHYDRWKVTYTAGYTTIPSDLAEACATLAAELVSRSPGYGSDGSAFGSGVKRVTEGQRSVEYQDSSSIAGSSGSSLIQSLGLDDVLDRYTNHVLSGQT